ncbi:MAG: FHA domain-containing protein [Gammaproteobacteria bacterium]
MPTNPFDDVADNDRTDELPVLVESVVLGRAAAPAAEGDTLEDTAQRTAKFPSPGSGSTAEIESLQSDLAARGAKIAALEEDIARLSARWTEIEHHLTDRDARIEGLNHTLGELRRTLEERHVVDQRLATELARRGADLEQLSAENAALRGAAETAEARLAALAAQSMISPHSAEDSSSAAALYQELASLRAYITNRNDWWRELKSRTAKSAEQINTLQRELHDLAAARRDASALAARESTRAATLRDELVAAMRIVEEQRRELATARAARHETKAFQGTTVEAQRSAAPVPVQAQAVAPLVALPPARPPPSLASIDQDVAGALPIPTAGASNILPPPAFEGLADAEAEIAHKRHQIGAQLVELRDREQRLDASAATIEHLRQEVATLRAEVERKHADVGRLERAVIEKDRALDTRDARIATLREELNERLGAIQKLNAMDLSLQGLSSKMSDRLRRAEPTAEPTNVPTLVCLTGDAPKHVALSKKTTTIGRGNHCDIQIVTHFVSRQHARVTTESGVVIIEDLASTNGVFVNSIRIDSHELRHGDLLTIGETQFRFLESVAH